MVTRWPLGLASSSPRLLIEAVLSAAQLLSAFTATVSSDEVSRGKPAPDIYLAVAEKLGAPPESCVAVEDSENGLRAALAAGLQVVAVPRPCYRPNPTVLAQSALVLGSLSGLTVEAVASLDQNPQGTDRSPA